MRKKQGFLRYAILSITVSITMILANILIVPSPSVKVAEAAENEVHVYADTPGDVQSAKYTLTANGITVPVIRYSQNGNNFDIARFASNDAAPEYTVSVKEEIKHVTVYPERYYPNEAVQVSADKRSVKFTMSDRLRYCFVMINGGPADQAGKPYLAIINDPMENAADIPDKNASNVLNFQTFKEQYLKEHPNFEVQQAEPAGVTKGGTSYEAGKLVDNGTAQVRFPDKRKMTEDDVTYALRAALDAIYAEGSSYDTLYFPAGTYLCSGLEIRNRKGKNVKIYLEEGALVKNRIQECMQAMEPAIGIWDSENITISGRGIFDGNGVENYRKDRHDAKDSCHQGGVMIVRSSNIVCNDTYVRDAKQWNWESHGSRNCTLNNIKGLTPYNQPWVDGLDMASAQNLTINGALTLGNDDNFASGHYNPGDGFTDTVPGYDQYNSDNLEWDTEDSYNISVNDTLGWSFSGGNGIRMGHDTYGHAMKNYTFTNVNTTNFTGGGNGITVQNGVGNKKSYPQYEELTFKNCSFDTTRVGTNFNINGLSAEKKISSVTLDGCWFSNKDAGSYVNNVENLTIKNHYVGKERVAVSSQAKLTTTEITKEEHDWTDNQAPVFSKPADSAAAVEAGKVLDFTVQASDADGEKVALGVKEGTLPQGASFVPAAGTFRWTPKEEQVGRYTVVFTAADAYETTEKSVEITVKSSKIETVIVKSLADATVKSYKNEKESNYGEQDYIRTMRMSAAVSDNSAVGIFGETAGNNTTDDRDSKISFLTFDTTEIKKNINDLEKAELQLTYIGRRDKSLTGEDTLLAVPVAETWSESELTWSSMPALAAVNIKTSSPFQIDKNDVVMAQDNQYSKSQAIDGTQVMIDVTEWVKSPYGNAQNLSLAVCDEKGWELAFVSSEGALNMDEASEEMAPSLVLSVRKAQTTEDKPDTKIKVDKVSISVPSKQIAAGKEVALTVKVTPKKADDKSVKWSSSNKKYAAVSSKGVVKTKSAGKGKKVTIKAVAKDGSKKFATVQIRIMKHAVKTVKIKDKPKALKAGKSIVLKTAVQTTGKNVNKTLKWNSSNTKYATVSAKGKVTAKKAGKGKNVTIRVTSTDGTNRKDSVKIKIR